MIDLFSALDKQACIDCKKCEDLVDSRTQIVYPSIRGKHGLLVIGEAPGRDEDLVGEGFVGTAGKTLDRLLSHVEIFNHDYSKANICLCRPANNRQPTKQEIENCLPYLAETIQELQPKVILTVGAIPTKIFCGSGNLYDKIIERENDSSAKRCYDYAHHIIQPVLSRVGFVVPTPHTSPLAFNRNAPSGEKWAIIAKKQIAIVKALL